MQKTLKLWRTFKEGMTNFRRNGWLSFATISVLTLSLFVMAFGFLMSLTANSVLTNWEQNINIVVSFEPDVDESRILVIRDELKKYREIAKIEYISRDQALDDLIRNRGDLIKDAVEAIGENPLLPSLSVQARSQADYETIVTALEQSQFHSEIHGINYKQNKNIYDRLNTISHSAKKLGLIFGIAFTFIALLITFNTIRITIYSHRQEFEIMRLVGASNLYVRMPFVFEGILYGLSAGILTLGMLAGVSFGLKALTNGFLFQVFLTHITVFAIGVIVVGVLLGVISSFIAIRRYLRV